MRISRDEAIERALAHHRAGRTADAIRVYTAVLASNPRDADALHLLGMAYGAKGEPQRACELIGQALAIQQKPSFHSNLGMMQGHLRQHVAALASYERALALRPDYPEALNNLGASLDALHRSAEAEIAYRKAIALRPDYAEAWSNLGNALRSLGRMEEAVTAYQQSVARNPLAERAPLGKALRTVGRHAEAEAAFRHDAARHPDSPETLNDLAGTLGETDRPDEAAALLSRAIALRPDHPNAYANLGHVLQQLGRLEEAEAACQQALRLRPDHPEALTNLGNVLRSLGRLPESETMLRRVLATRPADVGGYNNLAITLQAQDRPHEALALLDLAASLEPEDAETYHHRAMLLLRQGRFKEGWVDYEWRFRTKQAGKSYDQFAGKACWSGERLEGRAILLLPEQGLGDTIQFVRYAPRVAAFGGRVILAVQTPLVRMMRSLSDRIEVFGVGEPVPKFDIHCPLLSLPRAFGTELDTIPGDTPYLHPEREAAARWAARLRLDQPGLRVGLVWAGNPKHPKDRERSLDLATLAPLWQVPGIRWFSLQVGDRATELQQAGLAQGPHAFEDLAPELTDFAETAAAIAGLDLVIACDTSVAHLAGAIGRPVWVLLPTAPDWRWLRTGARSPWYPTMRLFRQDAHGNWTSVVDNLSRALHSATAVAA